MSKPFVYLAGPIVHLTQDQAQGWRQEVQDLVYPYGIHCLSPVRGKDLVHPGMTYGPYSVGATGVPVDLFSDKVVTVRDLFDLRRSTAMVLHLPYVNRQPVGSLIEFGFANALQIPVILWSQPSGVTAHPMIQHGTYRHTFSLVETVKALVDLLGVGGLH